MTSESGIQNETPGQPDPDSEATDLERICESLVFAADEPVSAKQIARVISDVTGDAALGTKQIDSAIGHLNEHYSENGHSLRIEQWAGGYRMATTHEVMPYLKAFLGGNRSRKLSRSLMETVAIVVYRQPATRSDIEFVRGVDCDYALRKLLELGLVDVVGRADRIGRPLLYGTTERFLELFGLNNVSDLPNLRELEDLLDDPAFHKERAKMLMTSGLSAIDNETVTDHEVGAEDQQSQSQEEAINEETISAEAAESEDQDQTSG